MVDGSSDWAVTASAMPVALALCSNTLNPAANTGAEGAMAIAPSAITPHAFQLKAPRLRIPWIFLAIKSVDGTCPPAGPPPYDGGSPSGKAELGRLGAQIYLNVSPKRPRCQTRRAARRAVWAWRQEGRVCPSSGPARRVSGSRRQAHGCGIYHAVH